MDLELSWVYGPYEEMPCEGTASSQRWQDVQDPFVGASGADPESTQRAQEIALQDAEVPDDGLDCEGDPIRD
jgi:hypothetical protein